MKVMEDARRLTKSMSKDAKIWTTFAATLAIAVPAAVVATHESSSPSAPAKAQVQRVL